MARFNELFERQFDSVSNEINKSSIRESFYDAEPRVSSNTAIGPQREYLLQQSIRPCFGKEGINCNPIGMPPEFINLENPESTQCHYICTLFIDIKGSTRLSLLYDLQFVYKFKNAVIQTCVEVIRSLDGNVHRLMGDAVMAFFGGENNDKENSVADALNCAMTLRAILEESIRPWMQKQGLNADDFGFRIGCDFGDDDKVLWGNFGYENVGEISATGLSVDMASKLQGLSSKNQTMLGQGLLDFVDFPEKYTKVKTKIKNNIEVGMPIVVPNLTDRDNNSLNYKMRLLSYENMLRFIALPISFREKVNHSIIANPLISYACYTIEDNEVERYISASKFLERGLSLKFQIEALTSGRLKFPLEAVFTKTNHGLSTPEAERDIEQDGIIKKIQKTINRGYGGGVLPKSEVSISESTAYRGLHTMKCEVKDYDDKVVFRDWIAVLIK